MFTALLVVFLMMSTASATVYENTSAYDMISPGQTVKADSDNVPVAGFGLYADAGETLYEVRFTIHDAGTTSVSTDDVSRASVYFSSDDIFDESDVEVGWTDNIFIGSSTAITTNHLLPVSGDGSRYFVVLKTSSSWSDDKAIYMTFASGTSTYIPNVGTVDATSLTTNTITADTTAPTVDLSYNLSRPVNQSDILKITATFSEDVDSPTIAIDTTGTDLTAKAMGGEGSVWYYNYDVPAASNGTATVTISGYDSAGNSNVGATGDTFYIDNEAPEVTLKDPSDNLNTTDTSIEFNFTASDTKDADLNYSLYIDGTENKTGNVASGEYESFTISSFLDSIYNWYVKITDDAGNVVTSETRTFTVDTTEPTLTLNTPVDYFNSSSSAVTFNFTSGDNLDESLDYTLYVDGTSNKTGSAPAGEYDVEVSGLIDGPHNWSVNVADDADNNVTSATLNFTVDTVKPELSLDTIEDSDEFDTNELWFNGTYSDLTTDVNISSLVIEIDGQAQNLGPAVGESGYNYSTTLSDGDHNVSVSVEDYAGNLAEIALRNFKTDTVAPELALDTITEDKIISTSLVWINGTYSDATTGVNNSSLMIDVCEHLGVTGTSDASSYNYSLTLSDGSHNVSVDVMDNVGNSNMTETIDFTVDTTEPTLTLNIEDGDEFDSNTVEISGTYDDVTAGVDNSTLVIKVNGTQVDSIDTVGASSYSHSITLPDGAHNVSVSVEDIAGNSNETGIISFKTDTVAPTIKIDTPESNYVATSTVWINGTYNDETTGVNNSTFNIDIYDFSSGFHEPYSLSGVNSIVGSSSYNYSAVFTDGIFCAHVKVNDSVGHSSFEEYVVFTVDTTNPELTLDTISNNNEFGANAVWINGTFSDVNMNVSTFEIKVDGVAQTLGDGVVGESSYNFSATDFSDGKHNVSVSVEDYAGNSNTTGIINFKTDTTGPELVLDTITEGQKLTTSLVWINGTYSDATTAVNNSSLVIKVNGTEVSSVDSDASSYNCSITLPDDDHNVSVDVMDSVGNSADQVFYNFTVDTTAPTLTINEIDERIGSSNLTISGTYGDDTSDVNTSSLLITLDGEAVDSTGGVSSYSHTFESLSDGDHNVSVSVSDYAGKSSTTGIIDFTVDTTAPAPVVISTFKDQDLDYESLYVAWDGSEDGNLAGYNVYLSTEPFSDVSNMVPEYKPSISDESEVLTHDYSDLIFNFEGNSNDIVDGKDYYVAVVAVDDLGNVNETVSCVGPVQSLEDAALYLEDGWNLVSVPRRLNDPSKDSVFGSKLVYYYNGTAWETNPEEIEPGKGYWVYYEESFDLVQNSRFEYSESEVRLAFLPMPTDGSVPRVPPTVDLVTGWNMVGHTSTNDEMLVNISLSSIDGSYSNLLTYIPGVGWERYISPDMCDFDCMEPGYGYWVFMTEDKTYGAIDNYRAAGEEYYPYFGNGIK